MNSIFHLAFPVKDIEKTKTFYINTLGCKIGKSSENWLNLNFSGHQLSIHLHLHMKLDPRNPKNTETGRRVLPVKKGDVVMLVLPEPRGDYLLFVLRKINKAWKVVMDYTD